MEYNVECIKLAHDRIKRCDFLNTIIKKRFHKSGKFVDQINKY